MVYFFAVTEPGPLRIKIGYTDQFDKRESEHMASTLGIKCKIERLCVVRGSRANEAAIHRYFADLLLPGEKELFEPHESLLGYIRWLRDKYYVWAPEVETQEVKEKRAARGEVVEDECAAHFPLNFTADFTDWSPAPDRVKAGPECTGLFAGLLADDLNMPPRVLTADDFYTNEVIIAAAHEAMGGIDLDPASHPVANRVVQAARIYTMQDDGLTKEWAGRVWNNPPFSQWSLWAPKILSEWESGRISAMCVLCATRTLTARYMDSVRDSSTSVCILHGRIPFWGGLATSSPDDGHAIFYFGHEPSRFADAFFRLGTVFQTCQRRLEAV